MDDERALDELNRFAAGRRRRYVDIDPVEDVKEDAMENEKKAMYIGLKEDEEWWGHVAPNDDDQKDEDIYRGLVEKMGVFRWQNPQYVSIFCSVSDRIKELYAILPGSGHILLALFECVFCGTSNCFK